MHPASWDKDVLRLDGPTDSALSVDWQILPAVVKGDYFSVFDTDRDRGERRRSSAAITFSAAPPEITLLSPKEAKRPEPLPLPKTSDRYQGLLDTGDDSPYANLDTPPTSRRALALTVTLKLGGVRRI